MARQIAFTATVAAGGLVALQAPVNSGLRAVTGPTQAATVSFAVGLAVLIPIMLIFGGGAESLKGVADVPWYYLTGGLMGAIYVTTILVAVKLLGAAGIIAATLTGNLAVAVVADRMGILGLEQIPISWYRILGIALLVAGTWLVVRH